MANILSTWLSRMVAYGSGEIMSAHVGHLRRLSRLPGNFTVRTARPEDEPALHAFLNNPAKVRLLLASGDLGLLAWADGRIHGMEWARFGPADYQWDVPHLGVVFRIPGRHCWLHNGRGHGLGPWAMILGLLPAILEDLGVEVAWLQAANRYSIQCHESMGFRRKGTVCALHLRQQPIVCFDTERTKSFRLRESTIDVGCLTP